MPIQYFPSGSGGVGGGLGKSIQFYKTVNTNPGAGNPVTWDIVSFDGGLTNVSNQWVTLEANKTYRINAVHHADAGTTGQAIWHIETQTGTKLGRVINYSMNSGVDDMSNPSTVVLYTPTTNENVGFVLDSSSGIGEVGNGSTFLVEEVASTTTTVIETTVPNYSFRDNLTFSDTGTVDILITGADGIGDTQGDVNISYSSLERIGGSFFMHIEFNTYWKDGDITYDISNALASIGTCRITDYEQSITASSGNYSEEAVGAKKREFTDTTFITDRLDTISGNRLAKVFVTGVVV